ncbi:MAG: hypothetical protein JST33_05185 [Actinobacteria bacterium]|nr:hypothetical protein [Actinomycetota bacterium]
MTAPADPALTGGTALARRLAFHNACTRYLFSIGRERLLPAWLARTQIKTQHHASLVMSVISLAAIVITLAAGADPFLDFALPVYSVGVAGLVFAQAVAAIAVIGFVLKVRNPQHYAELTTVVVDDES